MQKKSNKMKWILIGGIALVLLLAVGSCALIPMLLPGQEPEPTQPTDPTETVATDPTETEEPEPEPDTATKVLDAMDEVGAWIGTGPVVRTEDGHTWIAGSSRDDQGSVVLSRGFDPALDLRGYENGWLHMWVYVEDLAKMSGGSVELSSSGNPDARELSWNLMLYLNKSGWNEIWLPFASGDRVGGEIDLKNVNFMRIYGIVEEGCAFGADDLILTNEEPEEKSYLDAQGRFVLDEVESLGPWVGTNPALVGSGAPEGKAYVLTNQRDGDALVLSRPLEDLDVAAFREGYLQMWIYVQNVSTITGGQIELSSSGLPDQNETGWELLDYVTKSGWNQVHLPLSNSQKVTGGADISALNYIRIYALSSGENALGADYICMTQTAPPPPSRIDANNQFVIDAVEAKESWDGSRPFMSYQDAPVGAAWLATNSVDAAGSAVFARRLNNLDAYSYRNGYLHMWLFVENVDLVTGGQIELTSSGEADRLETSWNIGGIDLKNGWNELYLPISEATSVGGGARFGYLNYIRIFVTTSAPQTIGVDYIALSRVAPERDDPVDENGNYIIDHVQGVSPWSGSALVYNTAAGYAEEADWLSASSTAQQDMVFFRNFAPANLTAYADGYLHMWLYVDDIAHVNGGMVEITSTGTVDDGELYWNIADYITGSGWNELYLPLKAAHTQGETPADLTKMNCIRVVVMLGAQGGNTGIDEIYATNTAPEVEEPDFDGVIDHIHALEPWQGTAVTYHPNGGVIPQADYISAQTAAAGDLVFARLLPQTDASGFTDGGLQLWVYVDKKENLIGGMVEITSAATVDQEELWWPIANYVKADGWNLVYLPFAEAQAQGDAPADLTALDYMRVVMSMGPNGGTGGIDEIVLSKEAPSEAALILVPGDTLNGTWGNDLVLQTGESPVGDSHIRTGAAPSSVVCASFMPAVDIRGYEHLGYAHLWLYVEDVSKVVDGQIELTSSGLSDDAETAWILTPAMLKNGWNELTLPFSDAVLTGSTDYSGVNYMRVYLNFTEPAAFGLDEVSVGGVKTNIVPPEDDTTMEEAVAQATERSVLYAGSENMRGAIAAVLAKAKAGEPITLVTLGDSITAGAVAPAGQEWAALVRDYLDGLDGSTGSVTLINAGIGSTEAVLGVSRVEKDVLAYDPDLVIVDFGTNDYGLPYGAEAYEGILCKLISAGVPVINSNVCPRNGNNIQAAQGPINQAYGVPQISFKTAYHELSTATSIVGLRASDIWSPDNVHPTAAGHKLLADLINSFLQTQILDAGVGAAQLDVTLPASVTNNGFRDAYLMENFAQNAPIAVTMDGWAGDYAARIYQLSTEGWQTKTVGSSITFKVNAGYFYMFFALTPESGDLEIAVDGAVKETINWAYLGTGYMNPHHIVHLGESGEHTVTLTLRDNANVANDWFGICAVGAANFGGYDQPEQGDGTIDMIEADSAWIGTPNTYETTGGHSEGAGWLKASLPNQADIVYSRVFQSMDLSEFANGYLHMWMYVDDVTHLRPYGGMIEITSSGTVDNEELYWDISEYVTQNGWNELYLPLSAARAQGDNPMDLSQVDCMRIVVMLGESGGVAGIDELYMVKEKPTQPGPVSDLVISEIESMELWIGTNVALQTGGAPEGSAWLKTGDDFWPVFASAFTPFDASPYAEEGYLHLHFYTPKASNIVGGQIELSSASAPEASEAAWDLVSLGLKDGWNDLYLPLNTAIKTDGSTGPINFAAVNYIRIFAGHLEASHIGIDKIELTMTKPEPDPGPAPDMVISEVEAMDSWVSIDGLALQTQGAAVGSAWIQTQTPANWPSIAWWCNLNVSDYAEGYLHMWLHIPDIANLVGGQVELTSSGTGDSAELGWDLMSMNLKSGWNEVYLPLATAIRTDGSGGPVNLSAINFIRIYGGFITPDQIGIDKMELTMTKAEPAPQPVADLVISEIEGVETWIGTNVTLQTGDAPEGSAWLKTGEDGWPVFASAFAPFDASPYVEEGYLHLHLYTPNAANLVAGEIELSSASAPDASEASWAMAGLGLHDGWNDLYLPLSSATKVDGTTGPIDFSAVNYIRIYGGHLTASYIGIDKIELTMTKTEPKPVLPPDLVISEIESMEAWIGANVTLKTGDAAVGEAWLWSDTAWPTFASAFTPFDISQYVENGYLHLRIYTPDASAIVAGEIELSSASGPDASEASWSLASLGLHDGWNDLYLPLSSATKVDGATGPINFAAVNYIRIYAGHMADTYLGIDKIEVTMKKP